MYLELELDELQELRLSNDSRSLIVIPEELDREEADDGALLDREEAVDALLSLIIQLFLELYIRFWAEPQIFIIYYFFERQKVPSLRKKSIFRIYNCLLSLARPDLGRFGRIWARPI